jgi:hypothetical protein
MKKLFKSILIIVLALVIAVSSLIIVSAEEVKSGEDETEIIVIDDGDGTRAYELVWKFMSLNGHMYKRRWNATLGCWYDPAWILVY